MYIVSKRYLFNDNPFLKITAGCLFLLLISAVAIGDDNLWKSVPETMYGDILEITAATTKANYEKISSWQGSLNIVESNHYYGDRAGERAYIEEASPAAKSKHIQRTVTATAAFATDVLNDNLYCNLEPQVKYLAVDLNRTAPTKDEIKYSRIRSIVTPQEYLNYDPDLNFGYNPDFLFSAGVNGKAAFRDPPEKAARRRGDIRDPRLYINCGSGSKIWESISKIRQNLLENGNDTIAGFPFLTIEETVDQTKYRVTAVYPLSQHDKNDYRKIQLVLDGSLAYNPVEFTLETPEGVKQTSCSLAYEKIAGVFVPKTFHKIVRNSEGKCKLDSTVTFTESVINEAIPPETFTYKNLGLEDDVRFVDNIRRMEYWYKSGQLVPVNALVDEIVQDLLEAMGKEVITTNKISKPTNRNATSISTGEIFIPEIHMAIKRKKPFVFDIARGELIAVTVQNDTEIEQTFADLTELGKGHIAWDGSLITLRNAKALTTSQESHRPLKHVSGKWCSRYTLPKKAKLPYLVLVTTNEDPNYLITIRKIQSNGIKIAYKKLNDEELERYNPIK